MTPEITAKIINTFGLIFDIVGACFVAWEVVRQNRHKQYETQMFDDIGTDLKKHPEFEKSERDKYQKMRMGLRLLFFGFALQILSNWSCYLF